MSVCTSADLPRPGDPAAPFSDRQPLRLPIVPSGTAYRERTVRWAGTLPRPEPGVGGRFSIYRARIGLADAFPPVFQAPPSGPLLDAAGPVEDAQREFDGSDLGGGLRAAEVIVDGHHSAIPDRSRRNLPGAVQHPVPCPATASERSASIPRSLTTACRRVQVALVDAAGNRTLSDPVTVDVHNDKEPTGPGRAGWLGSRPHFDRLVAPDVSTAWWDSASRRKCAGVCWMAQALRSAGLSFGPHSPGPSGRSGAGRCDGPNTPRRPLPVEAAARPVAVRPDRVSHVQHRSGGGGLRRGQAWSSFRHRTHGATPRVKNRGRIQFRGRLIGGPGKAGTQITIEAVGRRVRQRVPVTTVRADKHGRFRFGYRFLRSFAPFTYRFRARLIRQASYPYAEGRHASSP